MGAPSWLIGVIINIIGSVSINFGTNLMKLSHTDREREMKKTLEMTGLRGADEVREVSYFMMEEKWGPCVHMVSVLLCPHCVIFAFLSVYLHLLYS